MNKSDKEKAKAGQNSLSLFFEQFGPNDVYKRILLEEVFGKLLGENSDTKEEEKCPNKAK